MAKHTKMAKKAARKKAKLAKKTAKLEKAISKMSPSEKRALLDQRKKKALLDELKNLSGPLTLSDLSTELSLETLEHDYWGPPTFPSYVVTTCHEMRKIPLKQLTAEHLRLVIGQQFSLPYLVPLALDELRENPLLDVTHYEGDLLRNLLILPDEYYEWDKASASFLLVLSKNLPQKQTLALYLNFRFRNERTAACITRIYKWGLALPEPLQVRRFTVFDAPRQIRTLRVPVSNPCFTPISP